MAKTKAHGIGCWKKSKKFLKNLDISRKFFKNFNWYYTIHSKHFNSKYMICKDVTQDYNIQKWKNIYMKRALPSALLHVSHN